MDLSRIPPPVMNWDASIINEGDKLTMDKAIQTVQNFEYCQKQLSMMTLSGATGTSIDVIFDATHRRSTGGRLNTVIPL